MVDYKNGKIYKLIGGGMVYYGSTAEKYLCDRLKKHTYEWRNNMGKTCAQILDTGDYKIILVEKYPCANRDELRAREQYYIENNDCINKYNAYHPPWALCECPCGSTLRNDNMDHHRKTKKHITFLENI